MKIYNLVYSLYKGGNRDDVISYARDTLFSEYHEVNPIDMDIDEADLKYIASTEELRIYQVGNHNEFVFEQRD